MSTKKPSKKEGQEKSFFERIKDGFSAVHDCERGSRRSRENIELDY